MLIVWRREELPLDRETVDGIIRMLMAINAKLERLLGEEEDDASEDELLKTGGATRRRERNGLALRVSSRPCTNAGKRAGAKRTSAASGGAGWFVACCRFGARPDFELACSRRLPLTRYPQPPPQGDRTEEIRTRG